MSYTVAYYFPIVKVEFYEKVECATMAVSLIKNSQGEQYRMQKKPKKKGGDVKKAPPGFYTPGVARKRLGVTQAVFRSMVAKGTLERVVPPGRSEGFYHVADVNRLADEQALFYLQQVSTSYESIEFRRATEEDFQGIVNAVESVGGSGDAIPAEIHQILYRANPFITYVVKFRSLVLGYINATPYTPETLEAIMEGRKRGIDLTGRDVLSYESGKSYDVYVGIVVRQDIPRHKYYAQRLIFGFFGALCDLARQGITIHRMYAISDQERSMEVCQNLGFEAVPAQPNRFILDMETAQSLLIRKYREVVQKVSQWPRYKLPPKKFTYDPYLEEMFQHLLHRLTTSDIVNHTQAVVLLLPLVDRLAESSQMTPEQQALLRTILEVLSRNNNKGKE